MARMESGRVWMHAEDPEFALDEGLGDRTADQLVRFKTRFASPPQVVIGLTKIDIDKNHNARISVEAKDIGTESFQVDFKTWSDTHVYGVEVSWFAYGD